VKRNILLIALAIASTHAIAQLESAKGDNGKYGFQQDGTWVINPQYQEIQEFFDKPFTPVKLNGKWGVIDQSGKTVLPFTYDEITEGIPFWMARKGKKHGAIDMDTGKEVVVCLYSAPLNFDNFSYPKFGMVAVAEKNGKAGLIDTLGREVIPFLYDPQEGLFEEIIPGFYQAYKNGKMGVFDTLGNEIVPFLFDYIFISDSEENYFSTNCRKKYGLYSLEGREIAPCIYDYPITVEYDGLAVVVLKKKYGMIDKTGKEILPCQYDNDDAVWAEKDKRFGN